jgi:hypothetical protein
MIRFNSGRSPAKTRQHDSQRDQRNNESQKKPNDALHDLSPTSLSMSADCNVLRPAGYPRLVAVEEYDSAGKTRHRIRSEDIIEYLLQQTIAAFPPSSKQIHAREWKGAGMHFERFISPDAAG